MKFKMKLPLDGRSTDVFPLADSPLSPGSGASTLATLPTQVPSVSSYSSSDSVAGFGSGSDSGSDSKSGSGLRPGSGSGSSIGSAPGSCSGSGSNSGCGSCSSPRSGPGFEFGPGFASGSSSAFGSSLGSGDSDRPAKDSATSGANASREATSSKTVVCAGAAQLRNGSVPPPFLAPPSSPATTYDGCHATRLEWNPSAKTAAAAAVSTFDPSMPSTPCSKSNKVSAAADMVERAGQLTADGATSAGVIAGEGHTVREPRQEIVEEEGTKKQEEVGKKRYSYIQIIGPGTSKKVREVVSVCVCVFSARR